MCLVPRGASLAQRALARRATVGLLLEWEQSASVYPRLDRGCQAVTAGQR